MEASLIETLKNTRKQRTQITSKNINHVLSYCHLKTSKKTNSKIIDKNIFKLKIKYLPSPALRRLIAFPGCSYRVVLYMGTTPANSLSAGIAPVSQDW